MVTKANRKGALMTIENMEYDRLLERFKEILRLNNLKFTKQREVVLQTLYHYHDHFTPEHLYLLIKEKHPTLNVGIATVYRTLNLLEKSEMVTSITFGAQGKRFELANRPHHDHMICRSCGKIIEFEDPTIEKRQLIVAKEHGFRLTNHLMQLYGICKNCNTKH
jgi:Fur family ferric uptake transcriptional regulator